MSTWYSVTTPDETARLVRAWADAPWQDEELCTLILDTAREQVLKFAPVTVEEIYEPVTLTWPAGAEVQLSRVGDKVTAHAVPGGAATLPTSALPIPASFTLTGALQVAVHSNYVLEISEYYGLRFIDSDDGPYLPASASWLGKEADGDGVPSRFVYAQLQQARNLWNSGRTTGDGDVGPDGFVFRPYPLDKTIKQIIRPVDGVISVL